MDLMQLKAPPDRVKLIADAIERDLYTGCPQELCAGMIEILAWLRHRLARWNNRDDPDNQD